MSNPTEGSEDSAFLPLSGLVGQAGNRAYGNEREVVDYIGSVGTTMTLQGVVDHSPKAVVFRVGVRAARGNIARPNDALRMDTSMEITEEIRAAVQEMGRRSSAMPVTWSRMDLFGVVRRLSMGCTFYSKWGGLTAAELRGGGNINVASIASVIEPIAADNGAVFVSAKTVGHSRPNILAALANAISGEGGTMYTDLLGINAGGAVQVPNARDAALAQGCYDAIRMLGALFNASGQGALYALAVTEGYHRISSLYGHSDEGAYVREVFRALEGGVPYGAVVCDIEPLNTIPNPQRTISGFRAVFDAIGIATAGAVALADPMVNYHGRDYPTTLVTDQGDPVDPGDNNAGDAADAADLSTQWAENCGAWARLYAKALNQIFAVQGGVNLVERLLTAQANALAGLDNRHLRLKVAVAFCWVEPTCSCPVGDNSYPAYVARHGPLATQTVPRECPALDTCSLLEDRSDNMRSTIQLDMRFLRRHGLFVHLTQHVRNGMGNIVLETAVVNDMALVGGAGDIGPRVLAGNTLDTYQWGRGLSSIVAGGELISLSQSNVITIQHTVMAGQRFRNSHTPTGREAIEGDVTITASRLSGGNPGGAGRVPARHIRRARSRAAVALALVADSSRQAYIINEQLMRPSLVDYGPVPTPRVAERTREETEAEGPGAGAADGANPVAPDADVAPRGGHEARGNQVNGPNAPITIEQRRDRGPRPPRPGRIGGGGVPGGAIGGAGGGGGGGGDAGGAADAGGGADLVDRGGGGAGDDGGGEGAGDPGPIPPPGGPA